MKKFVNNFVAFTVAEILIVMTIISLISVFFIKNVNLIRDKYLNNYFSYSAFTNLKNGVDILRRFDECTSDERTANIVCSSDVSIVLPILANYAGGRGFCNKIADSFNTVGNVVCDGTASIVNDASDFSLNSIIPNFTTSNGMKFYNFGVDPVGGIYTVYVDIDGPKRNSKLNEDILKFTISTTGKVLPTVDSSAATNREYLSASVRYYSGGKYNWIYDVTSPAGVSNIYNVNYLTAECAVNGNYDGNSAVCPAISTTAYTLICSDSNTLCEIVLNKPSFFLLGFSSAVR